jgi:hypothetical protein
MYGQGGRRWRSLWMSHAKRVARKLIAWADVFIESFAPAEAVERMLEGRRNQTSSGRGAVRPRRLDSE